MDSNDTSIVCLLYSWGVLRRKINKSTVRLLMQQPTIFSATPLSAQGSYGDECQACSSRDLQLSNSVEIFLRVASEREQEATSENKIFHPIIVWSEMLRSSPLAQAGIDDRAPFFSRWIRWTPPSFQWHNQYLRGLVSVYERPIIAGVRILIVSSMQVTKETWRMRKQCVPGSPPPPNKSLGTRLA